MCVLYYFCLHVYTVLGWNSNGVVLKKYFSTKVHYRQTLFTSLLLCKHLMYSSLIFLSVILIRNHKSSDPFSKLVRIAREIHTYRWKGSECPADLQKLIIIYTGPLAYALEAFKVSMLILWKNFNWLMILAAVITNAGKTGVTHILRRTAYFVNKCRQIFYWSNENIFGWNGWLLTSRQSLVSIILIMVIKNTFYDTNKNKLYLFIIVK
jgi:hypothetical protein